LKDPKRICVIVQTRLSSQRLPEKMIKPFAGTTLTDICLKKIRNLKEINPFEDFYLSAYEDELKDIAKNHGLKSFERSRESAFSEGTPLGEMYDWWDKLDYDYCILINACAPFLESSTIDSFIKYYREIEEDGLFGVMKKKNYFWDKEGKLITPWTKTESCMNTKTVEHTFEAAHCLYAGRLDTIGDGIWMGDFQKPGDIELYEMEEQECLDIDYPWQFIMCESIYKQKNKENYHG
jgi:CMP-N-acetylneuraminic acid synthetase